MPWSNNNFITEMTDMWRKKILHPNLLHSKCNFAQIKKFQNSI